MNISEIKSALYRKIDKLSPERLNELYKLLETQESSDTDFWETLSDIQKEDIKSGLEDLKNGRSKSLSEVLSKYER